MAIWNPPVSVNLLNGCFEQCTESGNDIHSIITEAAIDLLASARTQQKDFRILHASGIVESKGSVFSENHITTHPFTVRDVCNSIQ